ncbi:MAG: ABC transporter permease [Thalassobaculales bacterium]
MTLAATLRRPVIAGGLAILALLVLSAALAPLLTAEDPIALNALRRLRPPGPEHPFGTDQLGRDVLTRILYGGRVSLTVGFAVAGLSTVIGLVLGLLAGYSRPVDNVLMRVMDGFMAIPGILLAISISAIVGGGMVTVILAITVTEIPIVTRLVRSVTQSLKEQTFVEAARAVGTRPHRILTRHILPNALAPVVVQATYICGIAILIESALSFLGAGIPPEYPSWGNIMAEGRNYVAIAAWILLLPGCFVAATVLALNLLGDGLRDLLDPRMARRL